MGRAGTGSTSMPESSIECSLISLIEREAVRSRSCHHVMGFMWLGFIPHVNIFYFNEHYVGFGR